MILEYYSNKTINNTTLFFMPLIGNLINLSCIEKSFLSFCCKRGFANCYLNHTDGIYDQSVYMYFNTEHPNYETAAVETKKEGLLNIHEFIVKSTSCIDFYEDGKYMVYVISFENLAEDFNLIVQGKYSSVSELCKKLYSKSLIAKEADHHLIYANMVINKQDSLNELFYDNFGFSYETDYHDLFSEEQDYCSGEIKVIDFSKSNSLFKEIVSSQKIELKGKKNKK